VKDDLTEDYLSGIFDVLAKNTSVESLSISFSQDISLNLKDPNSLRFIEKNSTLKTLNFSSLAFETIEMTILNDALMKNNSITSLDLSHSNFCGPFEFLKNGTLKKFEFISIWNHYLSIDENEFLQNLKSSNSLTHLDLSSRLFVGVEIDKKKIQALIEVLESHQSITSLTMNYILNIEFQKLLNNPKLEELSLDGSATFFDGIIVALNSNLTIKRLNLSNTQFNSKMDWDNFKLTNKSLQTFKMSGNKFDFSKNFNLFKELLNIPSLEEFCIKFNKIGKIGVEYLSDFLRHNSTLLKLEINGNL
jgi:hypothetical protein